MTELTTPATKRPRRMAREPKPESTPTAAQPRTPGDLGEGQSGITPNLPKAGSKIANVIALLERAEGASLAELVEATGWLPHTTRAALTGLKKKGQTIAKDKRDGVTTYRIEDAA